MGKIACECGYVHSNTCGYDGALLKYDEWELERFNDDAPMVFECCECGNIMIDDPENSNIMLVYRPESGQYNKILHDQASYRRE